MKVLFVTTERVPYCKTGGLGDVAGALPLALLQLQTRNPPLKIVCFLPYHSQIKSKKLKFRKLKEKLLIPIDKRVLEGSLYVHTEGKLQTYFVENKKYFNRAEIYGDHGGGITRIMMNGSPFFRSRLLNSVNAQIFDRTSSTATIGPRV